jgi:hypothetical protein
MFFATPTLGPYVRVDAWRCMWHHHQTICNAVYHRGYACRSRSHFYMIFPYRPL